MMNHSKDESFTWLIKKCTATNLLENGKVFGAEIALAQALINHQAALLDLYAAGMPIITRPPEYYELVRAIIYKNLLTISSVLDQTQKGLYGPGRVLMRYVFEGLLIAKYCAARGDYSLYSQWATGRDIKLTNDVLNKIDRPDIQPFRALWRLLCHFAHASVGSLQVILDSRKCKLEISENMALILMLLRFNYHVLNTYLLTRLVRYYANAYSDKNAIAQEHKAGRPLLRQCSQFYSRKTGVLVKRFKMSWKFK